MDTFSVLLALNGLCVVLYSSAIGLLLARALHRGTNSDHWHLLHAGGTSRGVMLLALAGVVRFAKLPETQIFWASGLIVLFVWVSVLAMTARGVTGELGFHPGGSLANRGIFLLYACGVVALPIGLVWLAVGLLLALN